MAPGLHEFLSRFTSLFRKDRLHDEMAEELDFHQSLLREKLLRQGVPQSQVDSTLRKTFGNPSRWHERLRELWQFRTVENLLRDHRPHTQQPRSLGCPVTRGAGAVFLAGKNHQRRTALSIFH